MSTESTRPRWLISTWAAGAAFSTYFCMYAFRKPFTAGTFEDVSVGGVSQKSLLVVSQVMGYMLSKFLGIKFVSEMSPHRRAVAILALIGASEAALLGFALTPPPWGVAFLFLNGLPLGMVFGLVLSFLEGRRLTEAMASVLCASFMLSSGVVKSVGLSLVQAGVSEYWMPVLTGLIFLPPLLVSVWMLRHIPPPTPEDVSSRAPRIPVTITQRRAFYARFALGLLMLVSVYMALTIVRSLRDDFQVEIWRGLGESDKPAVFAQSELLVTLMVITLNAAAVRFRSNRTAMLATILCMVGGFSIVIGVVALQRMSYLSSFQFMVLSGVGLYIPYVAFHTTVFERLLAASRQPGNLAFLMYVADAVGYLGYVGVVLVRQFGSTPGDMLSFFLGALLAVGIASIALLLASTWYFSTALPHDKKSS